ncbi:hypothetical protein WISP_140505 [Willisornis vidua]|uniref:Uncharacterized protein n=1 Tax=Willisornis vidua TaxID=1566151 RepID=A0ABQ9CM02_9PASS|nr:hypothetical protein WISP_140505 [Willisornis vidua]
MVSKPCLQALQAMYRLSHFESGFLPSEPVCGHVWIIFVSMATLKTFEPENSVEGLSSKALEFVLKPNQITPALERAEMRKSVLFHLKLSMKEDLVNGEVASDQKVNICNEEMGEDFKTKPLYSAYN